MTSPSTVSITALAACGEQGKFYNNRRGSCCAISDTTPMCLAANGDPCTAAAQCASNYCDLAKQVCTDVPPITPDSKSFTTPGTFTFQIPPYNNLTVTVAGGGGSGGGVVMLAGPVGLNGNPGGASSFGGVMVSNGGDGGYQAINCRYFNSKYQSGADGTASGGTTNTTGGGALGGTGGGFCGNSYGGDGGKGGLSSAVFSQANGPKVGQTVTVVVGAGGPIPTATNFSRYSGYYTVYANSTAGKPGWVNLSWQ